MTENISRKLIVPPDSVFEEIEKERLADKRKSSKGKFATPQFLAAHRVPYETIPKSKLDRSQLTRVLYSGDAANKQSSGISGEENGLTP